MSTTNKGSRSERQGATDARTLDEIEEEENIPARQPDADVPSPDEGSERPPDDSGAGPM
ncbi:MAG TPA: hypothetical protein VE961_25225 [Pyrinomonadaceae bacterium]|nr:hypothetical protein [Pyrinomonadaceae bacterium]